MPLICFIKGNFRLFVVSNAMFSPGLSSGTLLYCERIEIVQRSIFIFLTVIDYNLIIRVSKAVYVLYYVL